MASSARASSCAGQAQQAERRGTPRAWRRALCEAHHGVARGADDRRRHHAGERANPRASSLQAWACFPSLGILLPPRSRAGSTAAAAAMCQGTLGRSNRFAAIRPPPARPHCGCLLTLRQTWSRVRVRWACQWSGTGRCAATATGCEGRGEGSAVICSVALLARVYA